MKINLSVYQVVGRKGSRQIGPRQIGPRQIGPPADWARKILGAANWAPEILLAANWASANGAPGKFGCGKLGNILGVFGRVFVKGQI